MQKSERQELREILANLYPARTDVLPILADVGLDANRIEIGDKAITNWNNILNEADKHAGKVQELISVAQRYYPTHPPLQQFLAALEQSDAVKSTVTKPSTLHSISQYISQYIVAVTDKNSQLFGTAFVVHSDHTGVYLLTSYSVVEQIGDQTLQVNDQPAQVVTKDESFDLALLFIRAEMKAPPLRLRRGVETSKAIQTVGYRSLDNDSSMIEFRQLTLQTPVLLESKQRQSRGKSWYCQIQGERQPGFSGAPVFNERDEVIAVLSHRRDGALGFVVAIETLREFWSDMPLSLLDEVRRAHAAMTGRARFLMNCEEELRLFARIASGEDTTTRLINLYGEGGTGKTQLVEEFQALANEEHLPALLLPLSAQLTVEDCLDEMVAQYERSHFANYYQQVNNRPESLTREQERQWLRKLTNHFFLDLSSYPNPARLAVIFEQYEKADPNVFHWWVEHIFLPGLSKLPITVLIAGREPIVRKPALPGQYHFPLQGVSEDWYQRYAQHRGVRLESRDIKLAHTLLRGNPKGWVDFIQSQSVAGGMA